MTEEVQQKLCSRLKEEITNVIEINSNGSIVDYKEMNINLSKDGTGKEALVKTITEKNERIKFLESDIQELKEKIEIFEKELSPDDKNFAKKIYTLQKSLDQANNLYQQALTQKSVLKIENQIYEKKLKKRNDKICTLVKENYGLIEQLKMNEEKINYYQKNKTLAMPQLVKVLRGSGGASVQQQNGNNVKK